jgi:hypothetical protein
VAATPAVFQGLQLSARAPARVCACNPITQELPMSKRADRYRTPRHACDCGRPALYFSRARGRLRAREDHTLCRKCFRSLSMSVRRVAPRSAVLVRLASALPTFKPVSPTPES